MAYATYITEAIVCGSRDSYTSDRSFLLFTKTMGMLWAEARSVREERSKQRYALQDFSVIRVSLVRGKREWRIGSVESIENMYQTANSRAARGGVTRVVRLLRQYVRGEESAPALFSDTHAVLVAMPWCSQETIDTLYDRFMLRTLFHLGYIPRSDEYATILSDDGHWLTASDALPSAATKAIARATQESHL